MQQLSLEWSHRLKCRVYWKQRKFSKSAFPCAASHCIPTEPLTFFVAGQEGEGGGGGDSERAAADDGGDGGAADDAADE